MVDAISDGKIIPLYNEEILEEYTDVLHRGKFPFSEGAISSIMAVIRQFGLAVSPSSSGEILPDMDDLVFYEVVMEKRREDDAYLITGNLRHFPEREYIVRESIVGSLLG